MVYEIEKISFLSQQSMVSDVRHMFNLEHVRTVAAPMEASTDYNNPKCIDLANIHRVRRILDTVLWMANSMLPVIAFSVS